MLEDYKCTIIKAVYYCQHRCVYQWNGIVCRRSRWQKFHSYSVFYLFYFPEGSLFLFKHLDLWPILILIWYMLRDKGTSFNVLQIDNQLSQHLFLNRLLLFQQKFLAFFVKDQVAE